MEARFGHDFSQVRVHTDQRAMESTRAVNALAYTVGNHIVFGTGQFAFRTDVGRRLLAHELAHVVQHGQSSPELHISQQQPIINLGQEGDVEEIEARRATNEVTAGQKTTIRAFPLRSTIILMREPPPIPSAPKVSPRFSNEQLEQRSDQIYEHAARAFMKQKGKPVTSEALGALRKQLTVGVLQGVRNGKIVTMVNGNNPHFEEFVRASLKPGEEYIESVSVIPENIRTGEPRKSGHIYVHAEQVLAAESDVRGVTDAKVATSNNACNALCMSNLAENYPKVLHVNPAKFRHTSTTPTAAETKKTAETITAESKGGEEAQRQFLEKKKQQEETIKQQEETKKTPPTKKPPPETLTSKKPPPETPPTKKPPLKPPKIRKPPPSKAPEPPASKMKASAADTAKTPDVAAASGGGGGSKVVGTAATVAGKALSATLNQLNGKLMATAANDPGAKEALADINKLMDDKALFEDPKGYSVQFLANYFLDSAFTKLARQLDKETAAFNTKYPPAASFRTINLGSGQTLDTVQAAYDQALAELRTPKMRHDLLISALSFPGPDIPPKRLAEINAILANLPDTGQYVQRYNEMYLTYVFSLTAVWRDLSTHANALDQIPKDFAREVAHRGHVLEKAAAILQDYANGAMWLSGLPGGDTAVWVFSRTAEGIKDLGGDLIAFSWEADRRKEDYAKELDRLSKEIEKINRPHGAFDVIDPPSTP